MGLSASQGRMLLLTARKNDLEFRAQQISQQRLNLTSELEKISSEYEEATSNRDMVINCMGTQTSNSGTSTSFNLTYTSLTSGLIAAVKNGNLTATEAGLQSTTAADNFYNGGYKVNGMYRLTDANGNIVISSLTEIPGVDEAAAKEIEAGTFAGGLDTEEYVEVTDKSTYIPNYNKNVDNITNATKTESKSGEKVTLDSNQYFLDIEGKTTKDSNKAVPSSVQNDGDGKPLYTYPIVTFSEGGTAGKEVATMTQKDTTYKVLAKGTTSIKKGTGKNEYVVGDKTYVVDPALTVNNGSGTKGCSNYLQECLRNGLYSIESFVDNKDALTNEDKWSKVSWDSLSQITDENYDDDDDAASAKYKRLQQQIETKDKKLEMELDNIETQRSAVTTEVDSVDKVIQDNVEKTFKTFA